MVGVPSMPFQWRKWDRVKLTHLFVLKVKVLNADHVVDLIVTE